MVLLHVIFHAHNFWFLDDERRRPSDVSTGEFSGIGHQRFHLLCQGDSWRILKFCIETPSPCPVSVDAKCCSWRTCFALAHPVWRRDEDFGWCGLWELCYAFSRDCEWHTTSCHCGAILRCFSPTKRRRQILWQVCLPVSASVKTHLYHAVLSAPEMSKRHENFEHQDTQDISCSMDPRFWSDTLTSWVDGPSLHLASWVCSSA